MMNESHAGTEKATGLKKALKKFIISRFDAALVGGAPHCRHFVSLGLPSELIHTGYDAIDNNFFSREAGKARLNSESIRLKLGLPKRYFLSLGRMVAKKNLSTLVQAFALFKKAKPDSEHRLVFVGSGQTQCELISQCLLLNLSVNVIPANDQAEADVFFCGFRQIHENPLFYALSDAFVLPSSQEEWGLVVNEAMACGLPVIVSKTVGSAEDLVIPEINGYQFDPSSAEELAVILIKLASDRQKIALMGAASSEIIRNWGCENFATRALGILEKLNITAKS
jgi:glycosyltransferase involved in cell wall biosynthesis